MNGEGNHCKYKIKKIRWERYQNGVIKKILKKELSAIDEKIASKIPRTLQITIIERKIRHKNIR